MQKEHLNSPGGPWDRDLHLQQVPYPTGYSNFTPKLAPSWSPEQAQVCRRLCGHISSLQNHLPKHCTFSQGSCVGYKGLLGPAKSLWQSLLYFVAGFYKKRWLFQGFFCLLFWLIFFVLVWFFVKCKQECFTWKTIYPHVACDCLEIKDSQLQAHSNIFQLNEKKLNKTWNAS